MLNWFKKFAAITVLISLNALAEAPNKLPSDNSTLAADIMYKVDTRYTGDTQMATSTLTLIDKKDRQRIREIKMFSLEKPDVEKSIIYFLSPSDVKGTAYMAYDWTDENREDDSWLYLPALQQVKRVAASDESGAFMGSDFSYADINGLDYEDFTYQLVKESEIVGGHDCWVIDSIPKNAAIIKKTGYTRSTSWIRKDILVMVQGKIELSKGNKIKYFTASNLEQIDGIWTPKKLQMITTRNGQKEHASILQFHDVVYNQKVDETIFDTQAMQRGI